MALLEVRNLCTCFQTEKGIVRAVAGVSYTLDRAKTLGIVGESGSGKSVSAMSILRLLDANGSVESGEILFDGQDLTTIGEAQLRRIRGNRISVIFQEPMTSLNPVFTVGRQLSEPYRIHQKMPRRRALAAAEEMLAAVHIPSPRTMLSQYPHQLSGGMRQRVMIAMALACRPDVLIADEPTTALDVTVQAQILALMKQLQRERGTAILFISHDLGVIREMADDVVVMYCGQVVEQVSCDRLFSEDGVMHPYTEGLMRAIPRVSGKGKEPLIPIPGAVPHPLSLPSGCRFAPRCPYATARCQTDAPALLEVRDGRRVRCHYPTKEERQGEEHRKAIVNPPS